MRVISALILLLCALSTGCETSGCDTSDTANPVADFKGGQLVDVGNDRQVYESAAPDGDLLNFSAGAHYRVFHQLGARPTHVELWVSFSPTGIKGGNLAMPAGNMAEILDVDEQAVEVRNNSCADYFLRIVAADPVSASK